MPGRPSTDAYVRTLTSGNRDTWGSGGVQRARRPLTSKGVTPSQAWPSKVSTGRLGGAIARRTSCEIRQCANSRSRQVWRWSHPSTRASAQAGRQRQEPVGDELDGDGEDEEAEDLRHRGD